MNTLRPGFTLFNYYNNSHNHNESDFMKMSKKLKRTINKNKQKIKIYYSIEKLYEYWADYLEFINFKNKSDLKTVNNIIHGLKEELNYAKYVKECEYLP